MARAKAFDAVPDPALAIICKVLDASRDKQKLGDAKRYKFEPGDHHIVGTLDYDIRFTKGIDSETDRFKGTPLDSIFLLMFHMSGAARRYAMTAAMVLRELRLAELEGPDAKEGGEPRPYRDVVFTFKNVIPRQGRRKARIEEETVTVPAAEVQAWGDLLAEKLVGIDEDAKKEDQELRTLYQEQIADCQSKLKVGVDYSGPINLEDVSLALHPGMVVEGLQRASA